MISVRHSLLDSLRKVNAEAVERFPSKYDKGLGRVGLILFDDLRTQ